MDYSSSIRSECEFEAWMAESQDEIHVAYPDQLMWGGDMPSDITVLVNT